MNMGAKNESPVPADSRDDRDSADITEHEQMDVKPKTHGDSKADRKAANAKDPSRPRRKKARRACFACQRAHLTCGDERPCQRCIKRGLQDACHDGVRKKAKYLHDAPDGALMPAVGGNNNGNGNLYNSTLRNNLPLSRNGPNSVRSNQQHAHQHSQQPTPTNNSYYPTPQPQPGSYNVYQDPPLSQSPFTTQSPVSPTFNMKNSTNGRNSSLSSSVNQQPTPNPTLSGDASQTQNPFAGPFFDPSDPALFNFDLSSMNFENRYGALEFGMLGHMATGAGDSPTDSAGQRGSIGRSGSAQFSTPAPGFGESPGNQPFMFGDPLLNEWSAGPASGQHVNVGGVYGQNGMLPEHMKASAPHAFAIESGPANFTSPGSAPSPNIATTAFEDSPFSVPAPTKSTSLVPNGQRQVTSASILKHPNLQAGPKRRHRNPSSIYESVKEPYAYTSGFHNLTAFIQRRFTPQKTVRIAKALASIRPSFIATTKTLNRDDLIFMEKCFQRTLWEYEDFINACGTPTIVCRRTGEIAAVGKEFSILTGWKKDVLLGKEANLNVNTGGSGVPQSGTTSRGSFTPRSSTLESSTGGRPQPVFLAELLDDDSVVEFYEDFARLAFGDSRGSVMTKCKLLKYKTKEDMEVGADDNGKWNNHLRKGGIAGEAGMNQLGFKDGKVECAYCWTVKRDVFDIPMLIVMNACLSYPKNTLPVPTEITMRSDKPRDPVAGPDGGPEAPYPVRLSGPVIKGFGRGSKDLGIPTANIPADDLSEKHPELTTGVYYGVVALDPKTYHHDASSDNSAVILPAVLSIGYNPFYKNTVRSVEIHIMPALTEPSPTAGKEGQTKFHRLPDFYKTRLNLLILGYIRPEFDYVSLEALVEDIRVDCEVARESLLRDAYKAYFAQDKASTPKVDEDRAWLVGFE
ncbi:unnamed protein product [Penicillium salamii]|nr:unnamed protein product [Penicillium salamii]CAG8283516.1 unnamed protein product [Penicillium salamii]CAG8373865.1 unnamed protein product [Penicillium salamii]